MNLNPRCIGCGVAVIHVNETMCGPCYAALEASYVPYTPNAETRISDIVRDVRLPETKLAVA